MPLQRKELEGILGLVTAALDAIRDLPPQDLEREQFRGKVYHCLYEAQQLIMNDSWVPPGKEGRPTARAKGEPKLPLVQKAQEYLDSLKDDLDLLK